MRSCFTAAQITNPGGRSYNEDHVRSSVAQETACWVIADGLGGHGGGADASAIACEAALKSFQANSAVTPEAVSAHVRAAHEAILEQQIAQPSLARMRTTIVLLVANATHAAWGHVGDSRLYHLRSGRVIEQTKDHSVPQSLVEAGEISLADVRHHEDRSRLLRSLGEEAVVRSSVVPQAVPLYQGDAFLLCSDGFWDHVYELEMEVDFAKSGAPADWLFHMENRLQERVDGSHDNYTAIAVIGDGLPVQPSAPVTQTPPARRSQSRISWQVQIVRLVVFAVIPFLLLACALFLSKSVGASHLFHGPTLSSEGDGKGARK